MNFAEAYLEALGRVKGVDVSVGSEEERRNSERFASFFAEVTEENVRKKIRETYAPRVFFCDTLAVIEDVKELERYFVATARNAEGLGVRVLDVVRSGAEYYVRWRMEMRLKAVKRGETLMSVGMSHLRFDEYGRIVLHYDFWDSGSGFFEHVPVLGQGIRWLRSRIHP